MEHGVSGNTEGLLGSMRALARKGASLERAVDGGGLVRSAAGDAAASMSPADFLALLDRGHLREIAAGRFALSRAGAAHLRAALNRRAAQAAVARPCVAKPRADTRPVVNDSESPLAWLRRRRDKSGAAMISQAEFDAGERLRAEFTLARMMPRITSAWDPAMPATRQQRGAPGAGLEMSERVVAARQRVERALADVGPELSGILIDVCCLLKGLEQAEGHAGWPRRSGKVVLQLGLARLARHYGLIRQDPGPGAGRIRHWGSPDYRPGMDATIDAAVDEPGAAD